MKFIELSLKSHIILHGFDTQNQEITEEIHVDVASKKMVSIDRVLSLSEKYILISYAYDRIIYWEYEEEYAAVKQLLQDY